MPNPNLASRRTPSVRNRSRRLSGRSRRRLRGSRRKGLSRFGRALHHDVQSTPPHVSGKTALIGPEPQNSNGKDRGRVRDDRRVYSEDCGEDWGLDAQRRTRRRGLDSDTALPGVLEEGEYNGAVLCESVHQENHLSKPPSPRPTNRGDLLATLRPEGQGVHLSEVVAAPQLQLEVEDALKRVPASPYVSGNAELLWGDDPAMEIARYVAAERTDLLVPGTHGYGAIGRALIGSVTSRVVRAASCPMLLVPPAMWVPTAV